MEKETKYDFAVRRAQTGVIKMAAAADCCYPLFERNKNKLYIFSYSQQTLWQLAKSANSAAVMWLLVQVSSPMN